MIMMLAGLRRAEVTALQWGDVALKRKMISAGKD
jgi:integrase